MNGYKALLGLTFRNRLAALRGGSWRKENGKIDGQRVTTVVMSVFAFVMLGGMMIFLEVMLNRGMSAIGQPALLPALALLMCMVGMMFVSFFYVLSSLYFSRDTVWLAFLPVKSGTVLAAKMTEIWLGETLIGAAILLPAMILYGVGQGEGAAFWLRTALVCLTAPMLPLAVITLLSTLITGVTAMSRHKDAWIMGGSMVFVVVFLVLEMSVLNRLPEDADMTYMIGLVVSRTALLEKITSAFPPVMWAVRGLQGDPGSMGLFLVTSVGSLAVVTALLSRPYLTLALRQAEMGGKKRKARIGDRTFRRRSPVKALFLREWNEILKTPVYAFNCLAGAVIMPVMLVVVMAGNAQGDMADLLKVVRQLLDTVPRGDMILIYAGILALIGFVNPAIDTAVSREGGRHEISRMIPVPAAVQLRAKLLMGMAISLITTALTACVLLAALPSHLPLILAGLTISLLPTFASNCAGLMLDVFHPRLHWANETQVIKQNTNVALGMLTSILSVALPVGAVMLTLRADPLIRLAAAILTAGAEAFGLWMLLQRSGAPRYDRLEDQSV